MYRKTPIRTNSTQLENLASKASSVAYKTLVVGGDRSQSELVCDMLKSMGQTNVTVIATHIGVFNALAHETFDLIVCDFPMPQHHGFQFLRAITECGFKGTFILVSDQGAEMLLTASLEALRQNLNLLGALPKPLDKSDLSKLLSIHGHYALATQSQSAKVVAPRKGILPIVLGFSHSF